MRPNDWSPWVALKRSERKICAVDRQTKRSFCQTQFLASKRSFKSQTQFWILNAVLNPKRSFWKILNAVFKIPNAAFSQTQLYFSNVANPRYFREHPFQKKLFPKSNVVFCSSTSKQAIMAEKDKKLRPRKGLRPMFWQKSSSHQMVFRITIRKTTEPSLRWWSGPTSKRRKRSSIDWTVRARIRSCVVHRVVGLQY